MAANFVIVATIFFGPVAYCALLLAVHGVAKRIAAYFEGAE